MPQGRGRQDAKGKARHGLQGIGKMSTFFVADTVTVHSVCDAERHGLTMRVRDMNDSARRSGLYRSEPIDATRNLEAWTKITLSGLKRAVYDAPLKRRLARQFNIVGRSHGSKVAVNGDRVWAKNNEDLTRTASPPTQMGWNALTK